jgi:3-deoxy-manno-octulosonate cytidylyltransferase (CMP-KDO synthetase)
MRWSDAYRHLGIYAYRVGYLTRFCELPPAPTELTEKLEQLRALWYGDAIMVCDAKEIPGPGVDTAQDLRRVVEYFESLPAQIDKND